MSSLGKGKTINALGEKVVTGDVPAGSKLKLNKGKGLPPLKEASIYGGKDQYKENLIEVDICGLATVSDPIGGQSPHNRVQRPTLETQGTELALVGGVLGPMCAPILSTEELVSKEEENLEIKKLKKSGSEQLGIVIGPDEGQSKEINLVTFSEVDKNREVQSGSFTFSEVLSLVDEVPSQLQSAGRSLSARQEQ
ncbi:hypothetical protein QYF36_005573 [Acer negundo]|nr:hypothetical protein QYF36_005573 [Acer negundo]